MASLAAHVRLIGTWVYFIILEEDRFADSVAAMSEDPIREWILSEGKATQITKISSIGGGCINLASRYDTDAGSFFVKTNRSIGPSMFEGEALGLGAMYETRTIRVPKPFKVGPLPAGGSYIIMEFIEFGAFRGNQSVLGRKLAEMHKAGKSEKGFGFDVDNTIGSTPQINTWTSDWIEFYGEHRLGYQLKLALDQYGDTSIYQKGQRLVKNMAPLFENIVIEPCLLHGDLWSGNISSDKNGEPVILDPACYYGHSEAEFGMSWCAGFGGSFYNAYFEVMPKQLGFEKRRDLYMLYHYLNHYNLFGSGYRSSAMSIIDDYLRLLNVGQIVLWSSSAESTVKERTGPKNMASEAPPVPLPDLILSLEQATLMAKQLPSTTDPTHLLQIYSSLHQAQHNLSSFISQTQSPLFPTPPPQAAAPENSLSLATGAGGAAAEDDRDEPMMQVGDDDYEAVIEDNCKATIDKVEEKMRDCFIKNKRPKRRLSPSLVEEERLVDDGNARLNGFDPHGTRLRALDLIYQFHA
ncbi:hypothetical protein GH714_038908 [Hevea brasiliensis]|uniref:Protein-ribulosamine 3-kinase, chloroplastic n=1 Tax=Hevea brasiliensis TaxID=3981 RepID=A0A6A6MQ53_HEVBR|nr:hypothetical protein GH714_038908 [Hevea brasiliensis]